MYNNHAKKKSRFLVHIFHHSHDSNHRNDTNNINNNNMKRRKNNNVWAYVYAVCKHNLIHKYNHDTASTISKHNCNSRASLTNYYCSFVFHSFRNQALSILFLFFSYSQKAKKETTSVIKQNTQ